MEKGFAILMLSFLKNVLNVKYLKEIQQCRISISKSSK